MPINRPGNAQECPPEMTQHIHKKIPWLQRRIHNAFFCLITALESPSVSRMSFFIQCTNLQRTAKVYSWAVYKKISREHLPLAMRCFRTAGSDPKLKFLPSLVCCRKPANCCLEKHLTFLFMDVHRYEIVHCPPYTSLETHSCSMSVHRYPWNFQS